MKAHAGKPKRSDVPTREVLEAVDECRDMLAIAVDLGLPRSPYPPDILCPLFGCHPKVAWAAVEREVDRGRLEYGTTIARPWLTDEGRAWLDAAKAAEAAVVE